MDGIPNRELIEVGIYHLRALLKEVSQIKRSELQDRALLVDSAEHAMAPMLFLLEQGRVLKPNGTLMLEWPPAKDYTMGENPHHQMCFTPGQAHALFLKAGFKDIKLSRTIR